MTTATRVKLIGFCRSPSIDTAEVPCYGRASVSPLSTDRIPVDGERRLIPNNPTMKFMISNSFYKKLTPVAIARVLLVAMIVIVGSMIVADLFRQLRRGGHALQPQKSASVALVAEKKTDPSDSSVHPRGSDPDYAKLQASLFEASMPVASVQTYLHPSASGTVMLIPQVHQTPGTNVNDPTNNAAEKVQRQIATLIPFLTHYTSSSLVMMEGDLIGPVSQEFLNALRQKYEAIQSLKTERVAMAKSISQNGPTTLERTMLQTIDQGVADGERALYLQGGAYADYAAGTTLAFFGTEKQSTLEAGAEIVRDYVYLNDQIALVSAPLKSKEDQTTSPNLLALLASLSAARPVPNLRSYVSSADPKTAAQINRISSAVDIIQRPLPVKIVTAAAPSRADNPYSNIKNKTELDELMHKNETKMTDVVINERNHETALAVRAALVATDSKSAIIQFGAGHEDGMVQELKAQGLSVIVITPQGVKM